MTLKYLKETRTRQRRSKRRVILRMQKRRRRRKNQMMKKRMRNKRRKRKYRSQSQNLILFKRQNKKLSLINLQTLELRIYLVWMIQPLLRQFQEDGPVTLWEECSHHQLISNNHWQTLFYHQNLHQQVKQDFQSNQQSILKVERSN